MEDARVQTATGRIGDPMATMAIKRAAEVRNLILQALRDRAYRPIELLQHLQAADVTESALKDELAELINGGLIELSPDQVARASQRS